ncbi:STAS domain-containing protein [Xanthomonas vasicola]|uniref:Anti-sigma F factor antagonist n=1 Tax=Xanthomonas vasicola pv. vasculorum NCPPB 890 TaxID=1184265 RepID=A0A836ZRY5_XANVA|nr:STAS domain-containing protein [Xanthomonas vasicola]KFA23658.1 anti-sigma F factor antagonist [Xanthomonas vasicola pv. vasculorum NCPPB 1326]KFA34927.1 anti-sigma F factor antagonist [Xanthomonas vasicola pv. vasculorum NCPPB 1381]KFA38446.1 anti-sigma F factor antagonist [Xanthomonas vasicola pv. vasculorum NCPPB 206]MBV6744479.1 STAS domain-containing protein [Xanthomonas vasicola pv. vasculorum NCPPB 890]MBV6890092.1 STAS domain-containing protein [Xanthomonas vasicola pv. vasculorum]
MTTLAIQIDPPQDTLQRVILTGRLSTHTHQDLDAALSPLLDTRITTLVLDLSALEYISSAGIRCIFKARKALATRHGKVLVSNPQPQIRKVFDMVKAVPLSDVFASTEELDAYLEAMQRKVIEQSAQSDTPIVPHFAEA